MITNNMTDALNEQINAELRSAYLYLAMSLDADSKALKGIANWFYVQWKEEQDHARILQKYVIDQEASVRLMPIAGVPTEWKSPLDMFRDALAHEKEVTRMIEDLVRLAYADGDLATLSRLQWFVDEQVEEEASVREQIDAFTRIAGHPECLGPLDALLASRHYFPAGPVRE